MAQTSDELKREISQTREQMAETTDALGLQGDVPTRTKDWSEKRRTQSSRPSVERLPP